MKKLLREIEREVRRQQRALANMPPEQQKRYRELIAAYRRNPDDMAIRRELAELICPVIGGGTAEIGLEAMRRYEEWKQSESGKRALLKATKGVTRQ